MTLATTVPQPKLGDPEALTQGRMYLRLLRRALVHIRGVTGNLIEPHGLTAQQFLALLWIRDGGDLTQAELANELDSDPNTVSAMMRRLAAKQLVTRERDPDDGRAVRLGVTPRGRALVSEALPDVDRLSLRLHALMPVEHAAPIVAWLEAIAALDDLVATPG